MRYWFFLPFVALWLTLSTGAIAQDQAGDYTTQNFPSTPGSPDYSLSTWKVVSNRLNCRKLPGTSHRIVGVFRQGDPITAETSVGSRDNLPTEAFIKRDAQGKPWMKVKEFNGCFVRANRAYIAPDKQR